MVEAKGSGKSPDKSDWQKVWDEWNRRPNIQEILGGRDPATLTEEKIDIAFDDDLASKLELGRRLFPPAGPFYDRE